MAKFRSALLRAASPDKVRQVEQALFNRAAKGHVKAAEVWLAYVVGRPAQELTIPQGAWRRRSSRR